MAAARAALLDAGPAAVRLNFPNMDSDKLPAAGSNGGMVVDDERLGLRSLLLAGGPTTELTRDMLRGLPTLYDEPYSHETDFDSIRAAAVAAGCTHVVVAAAQAGEQVGGTLKVAAVGSVSAALEETLGGYEMRLFHGTYWYCSRDHGFGFAPIDARDRGTADQSHGDDPLRLSWIVNGVYGGYRAGEVANLFDSTEWRKLVWGFRLE